MAKGGARAGAGRKPGSLTKTTREVAEKVVASGMSPLEVMIAAMNEQLEKKDLIAAAAFAEKAAPYCHPKLTSVNMNANIRRSASDFTFDELAALAGGELGEEGDTSPSFGPN